jgi:DNA (cytosine-5)-methyltransferase 1
VIYDVADDELIEDENLQVIGETDPDDWSDNSDSDTDSEVPVRLLKDFVIYDFVTNEVVPIATLAQICYSEATNYGCSATVGVWIDHDDDDNDDDEDENEAIRAEEIEEDDLPVQRVKLSRIIEFNVHHFSRHSRRLDRYAFRLPEFSLRLLIVSNSKIYIRTGFAWYILDTPSDLYSPFFSPFWIQHRILHLIVSQSLENPRLTYETFISSLEVTPETPDSVAIAIKVIGRGLTESDVQSDDVVRIRRS